MKSQASRPLPFHLTTCGWAVGLSPARSLTRQIHMARETRVVPGGAVLMSGFQVAFWGLWLPLSFPQWTPGGRRSPSIGPASLVPRCSSVTSPL